ENVNRHFDNSQLKVLMKREKVVSPAELENALHAKGSSLQHERRIFQEQFIAQQWAQQQLKPEGEEITHADMIAWYQAHQKDFETINDAIFSLPAGQLSPIVEATDGYHIVRVVERKELERISFLEAQKEIKDKIQKERFEKKYQEYVKKLREKFPIWTVFDAA